MGDVNEYYTIYNKLDMFSPLGYIRSNYKAPDLVTNVEPYRPVSRLNTLETKKEQLRSKPWFDQDTLDKMKHHSEKVATGTISDEMFQHLLDKEGAHRTSDGNVYAKAETAQFGEKFVTGPYGMVYKHIDKNGNPLQRLEPFRQGEVVSDEWAKKNAKAYYDKQASEWHQLLSGKEISQNQLDALVSASGGTVRATNAFKKYITEHWGDWDSISKFWKNFAITSAGNGQVQRGLVTRRNFEVNWFLGNNHE